MTFDSVSGPNNYINIKVFEPGFFSCSIIWVDFFILGSKSKFAWKLSREINKGVHLVNGDLEGKIANFEIFT